MMFIVLASLIVLAAADTPTECPVGYKEYSDYCFKYINEATNFFEAASACDIIDGKVLEIPSAEHQTSLGQYLSTLNLGSTKTIWLGATDLQIEGHWLYMSHHNEEAIANWSNWAAGRPHTDTSSNCAAINKDQGWKWIDVPCTNNFPTICFVRLDPSIVG